MKLLKSRLQLAYNQISMIGQSTDEKNNHVDSIEKQRVAMISLLLKKQSWRRKSSDEGGVLSGEVWVGVMLRPSHLSKPENHLKCVPAWDFCSNSVWFDTSIETIEDSIAIQNEFLSFFQGNHDDEICETEASCCVRFRLSDSPKCKYSPGNIRCCWDRRGFWRRRKETGEEGECRCLMLGKLIWDGQERIRINVFDYAAACARGIKFDIWSKYTQKIRKSAEEFFGLSLF